MTEKLKRQLSIWITIIILWMVFGVILSLYDHFTIISLISSGPSESYSLWKNLAFNLVASFMGSFLGGWFFVFVLDEKFRDKPYGYGLIAVCIGYLLIVAFITVSIGLFFSVFKTGLPLTDPLTISYFFDHIQNPLHIKNTIIWFLIVGATQFSLQMNYKFGHGVLWSFIVGRYHEPKKETRIFMFIDLRSSTTIAEKLGNEKYYLLLKDFYGDLTDAILNNKGQIYQYVGDEIVISWEIGSGIRNFHCLQCFFDMQKQILDLKEKYLQKYSLLPEFKAGMHYGEVTAGEIGIIKRDITYSGDVLNTTARIQGKCNEYNTEFLISEELLDKLEIAFPYSASEIGAIELRGKKSKVVLNTIKIDPDSFN